MTAKLIFKSVMPYFAGHVAYMTDGDVRAVAVESSGLRGAYVVADGQVSTHFGRGLRNVGVRAHIALSAVEMADEAPTSWPQLTHREDCTTQVRPLEVFATGSQEALEGVAIMEDSTVVALTSIGFIVVAHSGNPRRLAGTFRSAISSGQFCPRCTLPVCGSPADDAGTVFAAMLNAVP